MFFRGGFLFVIHFFAAPRQVALQHTNLRTVQPMTLKIGMYMYQCCSTEIYKLFILKSNECVKFLDPFSGLAESSDDTTILLAYQSSVFYKQLIA